MKTYQREREANRKRLFTAITIATLVAAVAFLVGYLTGDPDTKPNGKVVTSDTSSKPDSLSGVTAKKLNTGAIIDSAEIAAPPVKEREFTFTQKLQDETAPVLSTEPKPVKKKSEIEPPPVKKPKQAPVKETDKPKNIKPTKKSTPPVAKIDRASESKNMLTIQVAAFRTMDEAKVLRNRLQRKNRNAYIVRFIKDGVTWYRVRVGVYKTSSAAKRVAASIEKTEKLPTLIVTYTR